MSTIRVASLSRGVLVRGFTTARSMCPRVLTINAANPHRQFVSSTRSQLDTIQNPSTLSGLPPAGGQQALAELNARSIALLKVPRRATKSDIEKLLRSKGVEA